MKTNLIRAALASTMILAAGSAFAAPAAPTAKSELNDLFSRIVAKLDNVQPPISEAMLAGEIKEFDALLARHQGEKTDDVAHILYMKGTLYMEVLADPDKAMETIAKLQSDFPDTKYGKEAPAMIASIKAQSANLKIQKGLAVGTVFPDFAVKDTAGADLSVAGYKGKVVMIDFWATWCGPCVAELPNVVKAYKKYHSQGFEIIGISLDKAGDGPALAKFTEANEMPWRQYFDGKYWKNDLVVKYGVNSIPATYLLDGDGKIIAKDLRGDALDAMLAKVLPKK